MNNRRIDHLARLVAVTEQASTGRTQSLAEADASLPRDAVPGRPQDIIGRMEVSLVPPDGVDPSAWAKARALFLAHAGSALNKLSQGDRALHADERSSLEAVIIADGSRPSFLLDHGAVSPTDPFLGSWGKDVSAAASGIARLAAAVGRIQPEDGHAANFIGTGSLIDAAKGLIMTNFHVIESAQRDHGVAMTRNGDSLRVEGVLEIDFDGEARSPGSRRFKIVEVFLPAGFGVAFSGVDAAIARIEPLDPAVTLPEHVPLLSADRVYANGALTSLALIGFPAAPGVQDGDDVDWSFVIATLFGNRFGVKRLAPGKYTSRLGSNPDDQIAKRAIGHDATTFGGASGALVTAWRDPGAPSFALHFGGSTEKSNYALSFAVAQDVLMSIGAPFV